MSSPTLFSIVESPTHPNAAGLYKQLGITETCFSSTRKAISALKKQAPDFVVAEFFYGYGTNYAGVNVSNLDVFLASLQKYSANSKVIIMVDKAEMKYVEKLTALFPIHAVIEHPCQPRQLADALSE